MTILRGALPRAASLASRHVPHASLAPASGVLGRYLPTPHAGPSRLPPSLRSRSATTLSSASPSSVSPSLAPPIPPTRHSIKITTPSLESIKQEGFFDDDVALVPPEKAKLIITPEAVEVSGPGRGLRLSRCRDSSCHTPYTSQSISVYLPVDLTQSINRVAITQPFQTIVDAWTIVRPCRADNGMAI